jgi:hypothetical protein
VPLHSRHSLLGRNHSSRGHHFGHTKNNGSGVISAEEGGLHDNIQYADGSKEEHSVKDIQKDVEQRDNIVEPPEMDRDEQGYKEGERRKGILRKLNLHKA